MHLNRLSVGSAAQVACGLPIFGYLAKSGMAAARSLRNPAGAASGPCLIRWVYHFYVGNAQKMHMLKRAIATPQGYGSC